MYDSLFLSLETTPLPSTIKEKESIFLVGSCFSENFAALLQNHHFDILHNPFGTLFDPLSIEYTIVHALNKIDIQEKDLICVGEVWHHFNYHSQVSDIHKQNLIQNIITQQQQTQEFLKHTSWVFMTYGTAWIYQHKKNKKPVANCHKLPTAFFEKKLLTTQDIITSFANVYTAIKQHNKDIKFVVTISPVRHSKDGLVDNNQSKAKLIDAVHECTKMYDDVFYFPAYEYVIDVLRDYRFYEKDKVHPNSLAIEFLWQRFSEFAFSEDTKIYIQKIKEIYLAAHHRPFHQASSSHKKFKQNMLEKCISLEKKYPHLNLQEEKKAFSQL